MEYIPSTTFCSEEQIANLQKLLDYLKSSTARLPEFDMEVFASKKTWVGQVFKNQAPIEPEEVKNECGTTCCLAGHGPLAGVTPLPGEFWMSYIHRSFVPVSKKGDPEFDFLFGGHWKIYQPTLEQALFRLELFLKKGLPKTYLDTLNLFYIKDIELQEAGSAEELFANECLRNLHTLD